MESLFESPKAKRRVLPTIRRKIVDLKAEHLQSGLFSETNKPPIISMKHKHTEKKRCLDGSAVSPLHFESLSLHGSIEGSRRRSSSMVFFTPVGWSVSPSNSIET
jgi:hypothetical protein